MISQICRGLLVVMVFGLAPVCARGQEILPPVKDISSEQFAKRMQSLQPQHLDSWHDALESATGETLTGLPMGMLMNLPKLWKDDVFQNEVFELYLKRIQGVPLEAMREWRAAIKAKYPDTSNDLPLSNTLGRMLTVGELFDGTKFNKEKSKTLLERLNAQ